MLIRAFGFWLFFLASAAAQADIYKTVDVAGRVVYSNKPMPGATLVVSEPRPRRERPNIKQVLGISPGAKQALGIPPRAKRTQRQESPRNYLVVRESDDIRKKVLQEELLREESLLREIMAAKSSGVGESLGNLSMVEALITQRQKNIQEIQAALGKLR